MLEFFLRSHCSYVYIVKKYIRDACAIFFSIVKIKKRDLLLCSLFYIAMFVNG